MKAHLAILCVLWMLLTMAAAGQNAPEVSGKQPAINWTSLQQHLASDDQQIKQILDGSNVALGKLMVLRAMPPRWKVWRWGERVKMQKLLLAISRGESIRWSNSVH